MLFLSARLLVMFLLSVVGTVAISFAASGNALVSSGTVVGFILSHNIVTYLWLTLVHFCCCCRFRLMKVSSQLLHSLHWSAWMVDFKTVANWRQLVAMLVCGALKDFIVLVGSLTSAQLAYMYSSEVFLTGLAGCVIGLWLLLTAMASFNRLLVIGGLVRNPLHPRISQSAQKLRHWKKFFRYLSIPCRVLSTYGE